MIHSFCNFFDSLVFPIPRTELHRLLPYLAGELPSLFPGETENNVSPDPRTRLKGQQFHEAIRTASEIMKIEVWASNIGQKQLDPAERTTTSAKKMASPKNKRKTIVLVASTQLAEQIWRVTVNILQLNCAALWLHECQLISGKPAC